MTKKEKIQLLQSHKEKNFPRFVFMLRVTAHNVSSKPNSVKET